SCQTVDTTAQYDAVRAYLKELDISSAVWVGLIRSNPDGDFTWTDYRGLSGEGYWSSAPDARAAPLCAAADPAADYRWEARACGGPTVASFICELPVPQWALGNEGCMVRALPALTILYLPESAAVQLTADCGLAGVKRVQCTGNVKREDLLRDLACAEEEEISSTPSLTSPGNNWPVSTDAAVTDNDMTSTEVTTEDNNITTEHEDDINQSSTIISTSTVQDRNLVTDQKPSVTFVNANKYNRVNFEKTLDLDLAHNNNLQSNYIPKIANVDNYVTNEDLEKMEDEKHMQHKMLHEEIARLGNLENIFTQPTDHFVPPLVMAKAKISDDMTVLSLQEKHAQQIAEQHYYKQSGQYGQNDHLYQSNVVKSTTEEPKPVSLNKPSQSEILKNKDDLKKDKLKSVMPKKYNEKFNDPKSKAQKVVETKLLEKSKTSAAQIETTVKPSETTPMAHYNKMDDEAAMDLTVFLKDEPEPLEPKIYYNNFTGDVSKLEVIKNSSYNNDTEIKLVDIEATEEIKHEERPIKKFEETTQNITLNHEVIKITIISEGHTTENPTTFEITTKVPIIQETTHNNLELTSHKELVDDLQNKSEVFPTTQPEIEVTQHEFESLGNVSSIADVMEATNETVALSHTESTENTPTTTNEVPTTTTAQANSNISQSKKPEGSSTPAPLVTEHTLKNEPYNDEIHEEFGAMTNSSDGIDDFQSPLLSGANEPAHRPNRSRRPQQPNRNKFNPFRILG
ncbi:hypothetical protein HW555_011750, partial [Spodoptera exigua]